MSMRFKRNTLHDSAFDEFGRYSGIWVNVRVAGLKVDTDDVSRDRSQSGPRGETTTWMTSFNFSLRTRLQWRRAHPSRHM